MTVLLGMQINQQELSTAVEIKLLLRQQDCQAQVQREVIALQNTFIFPVTFVT